MKRLTIILVLALLPAALPAAETHVKLDPAQIDLDDRASLQRGARIFVNYCLSCHNAAYMRYNRMGHDLGISDELVKENLLFAADKVGDLMKSVMPKDDAKAAFGVVPPDLSVIARSRGADWLYTYMRSFYRDAKSYSGWNNTVFENLAMPHVLYEWQGHQRAVYRIEQRVSRVEQPDGTRVEKITEEQLFDRFELDRPGTLSPQEYDAAMRDLTGFMVYLGEPARLVRYRVGIYVLIFLAVFLVLAYLLKKEYWKDVH